MPELTEFDIDDQEIREAFVKLRDDARAEIKPPGARTAHRTVSRRRRLRAGLVTVGLVLVVAVGLAAYGPYGHRFPTPAGSSPGSVGPTLSPKDLDGLAKAALGQLSVTRAPDRPGVAWGAVTGAQTVTFGSAAELFPAGTYTLEVVCIGEGRLHLDLGSSVTRHDVSCSEGRGGKGSVATIQLAVAGTITVDVTPDAVAISRSGMALAVTDPRIVLARTALGAEDESMVFSGDGTIIDNSGSLSSEAQGLETGAYVLQVACAGIGQIRATIDDGADQSHSYELACTPQGQSLRVIDTLGEAIVLTRADQVLNTRIEKIAGTGSIGVAYRVVRS